MQTPSTFLYAHPRQLFLKTGLKRSSDDFAGRCLSWRRHQTHSSRDMMFFQWLMSAFIFLFSSHVGGTFSSLCFAQQVECGMDLFEPNNRRARSKNVSTVLRKDREITAHICGEDEDWYTVWLNRGERVEFHLYSELSDPPRLSVFAPRKRRSAGRVRKLSPAHQLLRVHARRSGRYRIWIRSGREARSQYRLALHRPQPAAL